VYTICGIAAYLDVSVVCWNKKTMGNPLASQQVIVHKHDAADPLGMEERAMTAAELLALCRRDPAVMHIEWDEDHYSAYLGSAPTPINASWRSALLKAALVTDESPRADAAWTLLVDKTRHDMIKSTTQKCLSLAEHLKRATRKAYHAVLFEHKLLDGADTVVVYYCKFPFDGKLTEDDFGHKKGAKLYISNEWQKAAVGAAPPDKQQRRAPAA
jgi:hypothetical protein